MKQPVSDNQSTLYHLIQKKSLTSIELRKLTKSSYPPARIADCEDFGVEILHSREPYVNRRGKKTAIAKYTLVTPVRDAKRIYDQMARSEN